MKAKEVMEILKITRPTLCKYVKQGLVKVDAVINDLDASEIAKLFETCS